MSYLHFLKLRETLFYYSGLDAPRISGNLYVRLAFYTKCSQRIVVSTTQAFLHSLTLGDQL